MASAGEHVQGVSGKRTCTGSAGRVQGVSGERTSNGSAGGVVTCKGSAGRSVQGVSGRGRARGQRKEDVHGDKQWVSR